MKDQEAPPRSGPDPRARIGAVQLLELVAFFVFFIALTFLLAGRLDYWPGWAFNGANILVLSLTAFVLRDRKDLMRERLKPGRGMKTWDKVYFVVSTPLFFAMFILSVLDGGRFSWSPRVPPAAMVLAAAAYGLGQYVLLRAKAANRFFSSVVRIQEDRGQTVCAGGPYRFVRHPGYLGGLIYALATPLLLGSLWGLVPAVLAMAPLVWRTAMEDRTLRAELTGYEDYARRVRFKLVPHVW
jgi:protein-S-isoprenylcysteine O-methyltransferase Ste14